MKSSLNQLSVDCTDTGSESDREGESVLLSSLSLCNLLYEPPKQMFFLLFLLALSLSFFLFFIKIYALSHKYLCICPVVVVLLPPIVQLGQFLPINRGAISRTSAMRLPPFLGLRCPGFNFALLFMALRPAMVGEKCHRSMEGV